MGPAKRGGAKNRPLWLDPAAPTGPLRPHPCLRAFRKDWVSSCSRSQFERSTSTERRRWFRTAWARRSPRSSPVSQCRFDDRQLALYDDVRCTGFLSPTPTFVFGRAHETRNDALTQSVWGDLERWSVDTVGRRRTARLEDHSGGITPRCEAIRP